MTLAQIVGEPLSTVIGIWLVMAMVLFFIHYWAFEKFVEFSVSLLLLPILLLWNITIAVIAGLIPAVKGSPKAVLVAITGGLSLLAYLITAPIKYIGGKSAQALAFVRSILPLDGLTATTQNVRSKILDIVVRNDEKLFVPQSESAYRAQLREVRRDTIETLRTGEVAITLTFGGLLSATQFFDIPVVGAELFGVTGGYLIEVYLLLIVASTVYRNSILELLAFRGDESFESYHHMDVAVTYQRAIALNDIIQGITFQMIFVSALTGRFDQAAPFIEMQYSEGLSTLEVLKRVYNETLGSALGSNPD